MVARADLQAWQGYVSAEIARFHDECAGETYLWQDTPDAARYLSRSRGSTDEAAFSGPWHIVRKHVTTEFRQWVEENEGTERLTLSAWVERERDARAEVDYLDSAEESLSRLREIARLLAERDAVILEAARRGAEKTAIARAVGITRQQVHTIIARAEAADVAPLAYIGAAAAPVAAETVDDGVEWRQMASGEWVEVF